MDAERDRRLGRAAAGRRRALRRAGVLGPVLVAAAVVLGIAYGGDSIASWLRFVSAERPAAYEDEELEDA